MHKVNIYLNFCKIKLPSEALMVTAAAESARDVTMTNLRDWLNCDCAMGDDGEEEDCCFHCCSHYSDGAGKHNGGFIQLGRL